MTTNLYQPLPTSTNLYQPLPISTNLYQPLPTSSNLYQPLPTSTNLYQPLPTSTNLYQPLPTSTNLYQPLPTSSNLFQPLPASTSLYQPLPTSTNLYQPLPSRDPPHPYFNHQPGSITDTGYIDEPVRSEPNEHELNKFRSATKSDSGRRVKFGRELIACLRINRVVFDVRRRRYVLLPTNNSFATQGTAVSE